jgi:hypothetical protein
MNSTYWRQLPTNTKLLIKIKGDNVRHLGQVLPSQLIICTNNTTKDNEWVIFMGTFSHTCTINTVRLVPIDTSDDQDSVECSYRVYFDENNGTFPVFDFDNGQLCVHTNETNLIPCRIEIMKSVEPDIKRTCNYVDLPIGCIDQLRECYTELHLAFDYLDQGFITIHGQEDYEEECLGSSFDEIFTIEDNGEVTIFSGETVWIDEKDLKYFG